MSINPVKKALLAGTALVAATAFPLQAQATATLTTNTIWASAGTHTNSPNDGTATSSGVAVNTNTFVLAITNNGTANDGEGRNTFTVGAITGATATDGIAVVNGSAADMAVTIASINETGSGNEGILVTNANDGTGVASNNNTTTVTGMLATAGPVVVGSAATAGALSATLTVDGVMLVTGTGVGIQGGATAGSNGILTLKGAGVNALASVTMDDGGTGASTGSAELVIAGTAAQTITGIINAGTAGEGTLIANNAAGVTFSGAIGGIGSLRAIDVEAGTATFNGGASATVLNITGSGTAALGGQTFTGNVDFNGASNTGTLTLGGGTINGNIDTAAASTGTVTITGAGTINGNIGSAASNDTLLAVNAGAGGTTDITGNVFAQALNVTGGGTIALSGTLNGNLAYGANAGIVGIASGQNLDGAVTATNAGTLSLLGTNTVTGNIGTLGVLNAGNAGGTATLDGTVGAATINIGSGTAAFKKSVTGGINFGGLGGTVTIAAGANLTGTVDSTGSSSGTLDLLGGTQDVSGVIGTTHAITLIEAGQAGGTTTFDSLVKAATLSVGTGAVVLGGGFTGTTAFTGNGTLHLADGETFNGSVATGTAGTGNFQFDGNGTVTGTFGASNALNMLTVGGNGTTATVNSNIAAANTTNVGVNTLSTGGTFTMAAGQTLEATITGAGTTGHVAATGTATIPTGAIVYLSVEPPYHPAVGAFGGTYDIVTGAGGGSVSSSVTITSSPLFTFTQVANANNLEVTGVRNSMASVASSANNASVGEALDVIGGTGNAALNAVQTDINAATTRGALNNVLSSLTPTVDGGAQESALQVGAAIEDIADTRMDALRADDGSTGVSSGVSNNGNSMWFQGYGQSSTQDAQNSIAGYTATTAGGAVGMDTANLFDEGVIGVMVSYGQSNIDSKNINATKTTVDNLGFNLYGTAFLVDDMFLNWQAGYGYNSISAARHDVGAPGIDADSSTNSKAYETRLELGQDYGVGYGTVFTPNANMTFTRLNTNGYQETGSGANLDVGSNAQNALDFGVGAKMTWNLKSYYGPVMKPMVHVGYSYAAIDDRIETTSTFAGAAPGTNPSFVTTGPAPERSRFDIGAGLAYWTMANWDLSANTNYEYRTDYHAYSGVLEATAHF